MTSVHEISTKLLESFTCGCALKRGTMIALSKIHLTIFGVIMGAYFVFVRYPLRKILAREDPLLRRRACGGPAKFL